MVKKSPGFKKLCKTKKALKSFTWYSNKKYKKEKGQIDQFDCGGSIMLADSQGTDSRYANVYKKIPGDKRPPQPNTIDTAFTGWSNLIPEQDLSLPTGRTKRRVPSHKKLRACTRKAFNDINDERVKRGMTDLRKDPKAFKEWQNKVIPVVIGRKFIENLGNMPGGKGTFQARSWPVANLRVCDAYSYKLAKEAYIHHMSSKKIPYIFRQDKSGKNIFPKNKKQTKHSRWRGIQMGGRTRKLLR